LVLRWIVFRMPILSDPPAWARPKKDEKSKIKYVLVEEEKEEWKVSSM